MGRLGVTSEMAEGPCFRRGGYGGGGFRFALTAVLLLMLCADTSQQPPRSEQDPLWCEDQTKSNDKYQICAEPSVGPRGGGTIVTVKGFLYNDANFPSKCRNWKYECRFGSKVTQGYATGAQCDKGFISCPSPPVESPQTYYLYVTASQNVSGVYSSQLFPTVGKNTVVFSYFAIHFLTPISGAINFFPKVDIVLLNAATINSFACRYVPFGPGWDPTSLAALPQQVWIEDTVNGVYQNNSYRIPLDSPASVVRSQRFLCGIPDDKLRLMNGRGAAQLWVEMAEVFSTSGVLRPVFSQDKKIFEVFEPPNVTSASILSSPYSGGTVVYVTGQGFRSYLGMSCQFFWCLDPASRLLCSPSPMASAMYINSTTIRCTTAAYYPQDEDCNTLCAPGGPNAPYRKIAAVTNFQFRKDKDIHCCGETCCDATARLQVAVNGVDFIPTTLIESRIPAYVKLETAPKIEFTLYADPTLHSAQPPAGPLHGGQLVTITGNNFISANRSFALTRSFCKFGTYQAGGHSITWVKVNLTYVSASAVRCRTPPSVAAVRAPLSITLNDLDFQSSPGVTYSFFSVDRLDPPFGGFLGNTIMLVTGVEMGAMEGRNPQYQCLFESNVTNVTRIVPGAFSPPSSVVCVTPPFVIGPARVSVSLAAGQFSRDVIYFRYIEEAEVFQADPVSGPLTGGFSVLLHGINFVNSSLLACRFRNAFENIVVSGAHVRFISNTTISCRAPRSANPGLTLVYALNNGQQDSASAATFTYFDVLNVFPDGGVFEGGTVVEITLTVETDQAWCLFGTQKVAAQLVLPGGVTPPGPVYPPGFNASTCFNSSRADVNGTVFNGTVVTYANGTYVNGTYLNGTDVNGTDINGTDVNGTYVNGTFSNGTYANGTVPSSTPAPPTICVPYIPTVKTNTIRCTTTSTMSPSIGGGEVPFAVSVNDRDYATPPDFEVFTFYPSGIIDRLLPQSGPLRGGTGITAIGNNFFTLCKTGSNPVTGRCYACGEASTETFTWTNASSCKVTIPTVPPKPCGLPCRAGKDDRDAFGSAGTIYCKFGELKVPARFMTSGRVKCFAPRTPNASAVVQLPLEVSQNDQQYTDDAVPFSYYTIESVSPSRGPTFGDTIVSVKGHNLFSGARQGREIQCLFWLDIYMLGAYDAESDVVLCPVPEQPAEMRDNGETTILFRITLNYRIPDQFTNAELVFEYYDEPMAQDIIPVYGPMNGGLPILLTLPASDPVPDYHHESFPYRYPHFHAVEFLNDTLGDVHPTICFGVVASSFNTQLIVPTTCCDNPDTPFECDGSVTRAKYDNGTYLSAVLPPYASPSTVAVELSSNGFAQGRFNPNAQWTRQSYCTPKVNRCVQASAEQRCITAVDCRGIIFKYWGITELFPISVSVDGGVDLKLKGNNFLHPEHQISRCVFYLTDANKTEFARVVTTVVEDDCDECPARDEFDKCLVIRMCRVMHCMVPASPGLLPNATTVELSFGPAYPITAQGLNMFYFTAATADRLDVTAGPLTGGTTIVVYGTNFIDAPSVYCQFGGGSEFSLDYLNVRARFWSTTAINCTVPACSLARMAAPDPATCAACSFCNTKVRVTMNQRDFLPGELDFWYRPVPNPHNVTPVRAPAGVKPRNTVTVTGSAFSAVGGSTLQTMGLSCRFGGQRVFASFDPSCAPASPTCARINCVPPRNDLAVGVRVEAAIDGQQYRPVNASGPSFWYYSISTVAPPYITTAGGVTLTVSGVNLDNGGGYACRFNTTSNTTLYSQASSAGPRAVTCTVPSLPVGVQDVTVSLDSFVFPFDQRDYTAVPAKVFAYEIPIIANVTPTRGYAVGGQPVTVSGLNFWNSSLLSCRFGLLRAPSAVFVNESTVLCVSPPGNGTVYLELSFNGVEYSSDGVVFANYLRPIVVDVFPRRLPAGVSADIIVTGLNLQRFEVKPTCLFVSDEFVRIQPAAFETLTTLRCQAPPGPEDTITLVYVAYDGLQYSTERQPLYRYDVQMMVPFTGPIYGGTKLSIAGYFLGDETALHCQYIAQEGLMLNGTTNASVYEVLADSGGAGFADGTYQWTLGACTEGTETIFAIDVDNVAGGFVPDGTYALIVDCVPPCNGSGLVATYTVQGEVVARASILNPGSGYSSAAPPTVRINGCNGVGGAGACGTVTLSIRMGENCVVPGCCSSGVRGTYTVYNNSIASAVVLDGGFGFNAAFPPAIELAGCDGAGGAGDCRSCQLGGHVPAAGGTCGATCLCSGRTPFCSNFGPAGTCACVAPNDGAPCADDLNCTGGGTCLYSAQLNVKIGDVASGTGRYAPDGKTIVCTSPLVVAPSSIEGFVQTQGVRTYTGMAKMFVKIRIHGTEGYTQKSLIFRYHDPAVISDVVPDAASTRGGTLVTVYGSLFKSEPRLTTLVLPNGQETQLTDMVMKCRLHNLLPSQPATFVNTSMVLCSTNRVCFRGSTQSGCQECIREGCQEPNFAYSHSLETDTLFTPEISMNDQQFYSSARPFYVYGISSFRPFGGLYAGGAHVTIGGINFDRGGKGPLGVHCRFSRIVVPGTYDAEFRAVKCISQPLLDVDCVLEVHLGKNIEDLTFYTDDRHYFSYYTAYPGGLQVSPDTGSFSGLQPVSFTVPKPMQYNHLRFRSFDFNTLLERVVLVILVSGERDDAQNVERHLRTLSRIVSADLKARDNRLDVPDADVVMGRRRRQSDSSYWVDVSIEPTELPVQTASAIAAALLEGTLNVGLQQQKLGFLTVAQIEPPTILRDYSEFGAFARFGSIVTTGVVTNRTQMEGIIATSPIDSAPTVPVYFSVNGQQFSLQPVSFFYYTVAKVTPFGVPFQFRNVPSTTIVDKSSWTMCPSGDNSNVCAYSGLGTKVSGSTIFATIRVYGNNFRSDLQQVRNPIYAGPMCRYGRAQDDMPGIIGKGLIMDPLLTVAGTVNYAKGYVDCPQPKALMFSQNYDEADNTRRIRLEVALNGRDFSFSELSAAGPQGLILYPEPRIYNRLTDATAAYSTFCGPVDGNTRIIVRGEGFLNNGCVADPPTCFCIFTDGPIQFAQPWQKVVATVLSPNEMECRTPPFDEYGYGYAASTFLEPMRNLRPAVTLNDFHWHYPVNDDFSFFDVRSIDPMMSAATFQSGQDRTVVVNTGNFINPYGYNVFCWWKVPGSTPNSGFLVRGVAGSTSNLFNCLIPDWGGILVNGQPAVNLLPCTQDGVAGDEFTVCNLDGSMEIAFGVAFAESVDPSLLREEDFAFGSRFTYYATPKFQDFLPKMGDQVGGTEINIYGVNFLDLPRLQCKFSEGTQQALAVKTIYRSSNRVVCITPVRRVQPVVNLYLTFNGVHWMTCSADPTCVLDPHPYYGDQRQCCSWYDSITRTTKKVFAFSYARRPGVSALQPNAAPSRGDTNIQIVGSNIVGGITGTIFSCRIDGDVVPGIFNSQGGLQFMTCLTRPGMRVGPVQVQVSLNEFEWSANAQTLDVFEAVHVYKVAPSFYIWDNPVQTEVTIIGRNFVKRALGVGGLLIRFAEFDANGIVRWKRDVTPVSYGNELLNLPGGEPSLRNADTTDFITFDARGSQRPGCTQFGARYCEPGVARVFVSQNEGTEWSWEEVTFTYIRRPTANTQCHLNCGVLGVPTIDANGQPNVAPLDRCAGDPNPACDNTNIRGTCVIGTSGTTGQAATTGTCQCTRPDCAVLPPGCSVLTCAVGGYDCGNIGQQVELGCSIKAAITDVYPRSGPQVGGTSVSIRGFLLKRNDLLTDAYRCKFGTQQTPANWDNALGLIVCNTPPLQVNGSVEVEVSISYGQEWTESHGEHLFHYYFPPTIMGLEPSVGPATGNTAVRIIAGFTDKMMALGTKFRRLDTNIYGEPVCLGDTSTDTCNGMSKFGSYSDFGPITPGLEGFCVWEPHCKFQLKEQHDLKCDFRSPLASYWNVPLESTSVDYVLPNVIECRTPSYSLLLNNSLGLSFDDMTVRLTLNGQLWHTSPQIFRYHTVNNITNITPTVGPPTGRIWVALIGSGFVDTPLAICRFGASFGLGFEFVNSSYVRCLAPPSEVLQTVWVSVSFNGVQFADAAEMFTYISLWTLDKLEPEIGQERGGLIVSIRGTNFVDSKTLSCKFGDAIVEGNLTNYESETYVTCVLPERILPRPKFVTSASTCDGAIVPGTKRLDDGWTVCRYCTDCCNCPDCPECSPRCLCSGDVLLDGNAICCESTQGRQFQELCPPQPLLQEFTPRSLCLPPEYRCEWVSIDATTQELSCTLLPFRGVLLEPPQDTVLEIADGEVLHPDLALRLSIPFYLSLDGQTWVSGCVRNPVFGTPLHVPPPCITNDDSSYERWFGWFTYIENHNVTMSIPEIAPTAGGTRITVIGEGFVQSRSIKCKFGYKSDGTFDPENPTDLTTGDLVGVVPNETPATFVDSFRIVCDSPAVDLNVHPLGSGNGGNTAFLIVPIEVSIGGSLAEYTDNKVPFAFAENWVVTAIRPSTVPSVGGSYITLIGPYFRATDQTMCRFGTCPPTENNCPDVLYATEVRHINDNTIVCRTPSVNIHQRINVSVTLDGQYWSTPTNTTIIEFHGVRNALTFGENEYGQLGFNQIRDRVVSDYSCYGGKFNGFECTTTADCPAGQCLFATRNLNWIPTFLRELFAHNISSITMGQTHTLVVSSETYNDTWGTYPRIGLVYGWGDNLVGQLGLSFTGPSLFAYNFSAPYVLVCPTEETYMLDRRLDDRPILGLPDTWPQTDWIVPTCISKQDVRVEGVWETNFVTVYNPFYYAFMKRVVAGSFHSLALTSTGDLYAWGWNTDEQLGQGPIETRRAIPFPIHVFYFRRRINVKIISIGAGFAHSAAVADDGNLYTWGNNKYGQLGLGDYVARSFPTRVTGFVDSSGATYKISDVSCGLYHCLALTTNGKVWSFGSNSRGQLGTCASPITRTESLDLQCDPTPVVNLGKFNTVPKPVLVDFLDITDYTGGVIGQPFITRIACGAFHSMAIGSPCITQLSQYGDACPQFDFNEGDLYTWGNNRYGQLGLGTSSDFAFKQTPTMVLGLQTAGTRCRQTESPTDTGCILSEDFFRKGRRVIAADAGSWHTLVFVEQREQIGYRRSFMPVNRMYTMGNNEEGQLGLGDTVDRNVPSRVQLNYVKLHQVGGNFYQSIFTLGCLPNDWNVCQGNGLCYEQGVCKCYAGYRGVDCSIVCDGGAGGNVCSGHGNESLAVMISGWRQQVIRASSGWRLVTRLNTLFTEYRCDDAKLNLTKEYRTVEACRAVCTRCVARERNNVSSAEVVRMLDQVQTEFPAMSTAVRLVKEDWPITLFNQGLRYWRYPFEARQEKLTPSTWGPWKGSWQRRDVIPMLQMLQNRSTCWAEYSCNTERAECEVIPGQVRGRVGESNLDVNPGCRDGITAKIHWRKRIEEIDQAWSNLEMEVWQCDPQQIADEFGLRKEQVQYIWAAFQTNPQNISDYLMSHDANSPLAVPFPTEPLSTIQQVWAILDEGCQNSTIGQAERGCMFDGSCMCQHGWTGPGCDIQCLGGFANPCNGNGVCRFDGRCECDRGWTGAVCDVECSGAAEHPDHFPCNLNGFCNGWYVDARTQFEYGPIDFEQARYVSRGQGLSFYETGTGLAQNGTCTCHYGFRSDWGMSDCGVRCPGTPDTYLDELGECFDNGVCNATGKCVCYEGYRNVSCNVECLGGHRVEIGGSALYSNECTARPVCDVYPLYPITTADQRQVLCRDMDRLGDDYSKDYSFAASGQVLRVYNGLCQYMDFDPPNVHRMNPIPSCPGEVWCDPDLKVAGPGGDCGLDLARETFCVEHLTKTKNFTGQPFNASFQTTDPLLGSPDDRGCPMQQCEQLGDYIKDMGYDAQEAGRFGWTGPRPDLSQHHSTTMGHCYCLPGFRGPNCSKTCPGAIPDPTIETGIRRPFPATLDIRNPLYPRAEPGAPYPPLVGNKVEMRQVTEGDPNSIASSVIYGLDSPRGWDSNQDGLPDGVAARPLINICNGHGFCEEDATCSCFLTDKGPHTNYTDVSGYRGDACELECPGGAAFICSWAGVCNEANECTCFKGYRGIDCRIQCLGARDCDPRFGCAGVCNYAGQCGELGNCTCDAAYRGEACEKVCPPFTGRLQDVCNGRGECNADAECECGIFYEGVACELIAGWVIFLFIFIIFLLFGVCIHIVRRYLHGRMRQKRRARRERRKVRRTQAAVGRLKTYKVAMPDAAALEAKGL